MTLKTIRQLNQLNQAFYNQVGPDFDDSRQFAWPGWLELLPYLKELAKTKKQSLRILDLGCGNGRFARFLKEQLPDTKLEYTGIDSNKHLLTKAISLCHDLDIPAKLIPQDLVESLIAKQFPTLTAQRYDLIVIFGVMHHIPSFELRQQLLAESANYLHTQGLLVFTTWQFMEFERFQKKVIEPKLVGIEHNQLEPNDFILTWEKGSTAFRYAHFIDEQERNQLLSTTQLQFLLTFKADGKEKKVNSYVVCSTVEEGE